MDLSGVLGWGALWWFFFLSGGRLGGDVAYDVIFGMVSESFGEGFLLNSAQKMGSS